MREKVESILMDNIYTCEAGRTPSSIADKILALVEGQRCEWTQKPDNDWNTGCGKLMFSEHAMPDGAPFCPCCGKKIKVKNDKRD